MTSAQIKELGHACGFEIVGVAAAIPHPDFARFKTWAQSGKAGEMHYLTDRRGDLRSDPRSLLPSAQSIICLGKIYNTSHPLSVDVRVPGKGWISRYAWGRDYHDVLRPALELLTERLVRLHGQPFESKICIDTAPLLERSYAASAGLGWVGKNTCLINQRHGSWFFLAELLVSIPIAPDLPASHHCGTCTRCIQACPTSAIVPSHNSGGFEIDARLCISYLTIEKRGPANPHLSTATGTHIFGCDICQDVCPWNHRAHRSATDTTLDLSFAPANFNPDLAALARLDEDDFHRLFRYSPIWRTKYEGFLRNVAVAMGNSKLEQMRQPLTHLSAHPNPIVSQTAKAALSRLLQEPSQVSPTPPVNRRY